MENKHSSDGIAEDMIRSFVQVGCAELHAKTLLEKFSAELENGIVDVEATIYCEKASHKGILIGKSGSMLRKIGAEAREDMEALLGTKVFLQTWVKVKENWRDSEVQIRNFGYRND